MARRWIILATLTLARTAMGFQFQSVPAVAPHLTGGFGMSYAVLGTLIGLYLLPGAAVAIPGGWLGQRFGDKRMVLVGLALMTVGGVALGLSAAVPAMMAGRLVSGTGAVLLNVLVTKMVADWFDGRALVTAMGLLMVSWPLGLSLGLVLLPGLAAAFGWPAAMLAPAAVAAACLALLWAVYEPPPGPGPEPAEAPGILIGRREAVLAMLAGLVWTWFNMGFISVLAFGPDFLVSRGEDPVAAAATVSLVSWLIMPSLAAGGWISARIGRPDLTMAACFLAVAVLMAAVPSAGSSVLLFAAIGLLFGPGAPLVMVLPVEAVRAESRAIGMGIYFTCYYLGMAAVAPLAGLVRDVTGSAAAPLWFGAGMMLVALGCLGGFRAAQRRFAAAPAG